MIKVSEIQNLDQEFHLLSVALNCDIQEQDVLLLEAFWDLLEQEDAFRAWCAERDAERPFDLSDAGPEYD